MPPFGHKLLILVPVAAVFWGLGCGRSAPSENPTPQQPRAERAERTTAETLPPDTVPTSAAEPSGEKGPQVVLDAWGDFPKDVFFDDPFAELKEGLLSEKPSELETQRTGESVASQRATDDAKPEDPAPNEKVTWSELISAKDLTEETTRIRRQLASQLSSVAAYNENYRAVRVEANVLAVLAGIAAQHEERIGWKSNAVAIRDTASELASSVGGLGERFQKPALAHFTTIRDLLIANAPANEVNRNPILDMPWSNVAERSQLMRRMNLAQDERIKPFTAGAREFRKNSDQIAREASLLAALAHVISTSYDESDDAIYQSHCQALRDQSRQLAQAARDVDFSRAAKLAGANLKTCNACHAEFRFEDSQF